MKNFNLKFMMIILIAVALLATNVSGVFAVPPVSELLIRHGYIREPDNVEALRPCIVGREFVVAAQSPEVTRVVYDVFQRGGNIWDAAIPGMWVQMVTSAQIMPGTASYTIYVADEGEAKSYCGVGTAPAVATIDYFTERDHLYMPTDLHFLRTVVPPEPDGMFALLERYGTMSFTEVMQGALELMEKGHFARSYEVYAARGYLHEPKLSDPAFVENRAYFLQHGKDIAYGDLMVDKGLARTLRILMDAEQRALEAGATREEALRAARDEFYTGEIAKAIDRFSRENDGTLTYNDLASYNGKWYEQHELPHTTFMGIDFYAAPTYTQAGVLLMYLNMLEHFDIEALGYNTPEYIHVITQIISLAMADRWQYFGDPVFIDVPEELWSKEYAAERVKLIDMEKAFDKIPPPGDPRNMKPVLEGWKPWALAPNAITEKDLKNMLAYVEEDKDTVYMNIMDNEGNIFAYCPSDGRTGNPMVPGYGFGIPSRARQFTLDPELPHSIAPGKRPTTTPHTWVAVKDGEGYLCANTPGGDKQTQSTIQTLLNVLVWGMNPQQAVEQPVFKTDNLLSMFTPYVEGRYFPGQTGLEKDLPDELVPALEKLGHKIVRTSNFWGISYCPTFIIRDPEKKLIYGGAYVGWEGYAYGR